MGDVLMKMTAEGRNAFELWAAGRPEVVRQLIDRWPPDQLYRNTETDQVMAIQGYNEDGTVRALVVPECNGPITGGSSVFGIDPGELVPTTQEYVDSREAKFTTVRAMLTAAFDGQESN